MRVRKIPNFYCIGTQKAGTTSLHDIFSRHSDFFLPEPKEAHYFHKDELYKKGLDWYLDTFFKDVKDEKVIGSFTPDYLYFGKSAERIYETLGSDIKFVIVLRNPADRAYSHYTMSKFRGYESLSFSEAILLEEERLKKDFFHQNHFSYIDRGYYHRQIQNYLRYFPSENFLILNFENDVEKNINNAISKICKFLNLTPLSVKDDLKSNTAKSPWLPFLNRWLFRTPETLQRVFNYIPVRVKRKLRPGLLKLNARPAKTSSIDGNLKRDLIMNKYKDDIMKLEKNFSFQHNWFNS